MDTKIFRIDFKNSIKEIVDCNFIDVGIATTPAIEFAVRHFNADGGVIITASTTSLTGTASSFSAVTELF